MCTWPGSEEALESTNICILLRTNLMESTPKGRLNLGAGFKVISNSPKKLFLKSHDLNKSLVEDANCSEASESHQSESDEEDIPTELGLFIERLVLNTEQKKRCRLQYKGELSRWSTFFTDIFYEKTRQKRTDLSKLLQQKRFNRQAYEGRVAVIKFLSCQLFDCDNFKDVLSFLVSFSGEPVRQVQLQNSISITEDDLLYTHFSIGGSYALLKRVISAWKFVLKKRCPIRAKFPEDSDVVKYRKRLSVPDIQIFKNPNGNKVGRICSLKELHKHDFFSTERLLSTWIFIWETGHTLLPFH